MKKFIHPLLAIAGILIITAVYFSPMLEGKVLKPQDVTMYLGMSKEVKDFRAETGEDPLWTNRAFSGMPAYLISVKYKGDLVKKLLVPILKIPRPASYLILNFLLFYIALMLLGVKNWISLVGSLMYGFNSAFFIWLDTGHMTKALTLTFMALAVGGIMYAYNKKRVMGSVIAAIALSWMISANHPQITYYAGIMILILGLTYLVFAIKEKQLANFLKTSGLLLIAVILAAGTNYSRLTMVMEYGKYSTRGESELTDTKGVKTSGLDKDYILDYSYDMAEAVSAFIPRFKGGGNAEPLGEKSHVYQLIAPQDRNYAKRISQALPLYWGSQPITMAPFYFGAVLVYLFVFGLFVLKGKDKWWLAMTVLVAFLLSLGKYFPALSNFMIDHFPGYNKFRDVKNIIVIQQFAMALTGVFAIKQVVDRNISDKQFINALKYSVAIAGGFALLFALIPGLAGDFSGAMDARMGNAAIVDALKADRKMVLRADAFRSFIFVALSAIVLFAYWKNKLKAQYALAAWAILILTDMWPVDKKYLNNNDFISKRKAEVPIPKTKADQFILTDKDPDYRVLNLTVDPFSDGTTSYYHKSLGGYHGAKLQRYQELISNGIYPDIQKMQNAFKTIRTQEDVDRMFASLHILNMLNTRYVIHNRDAQPLMNRSALGNAWFVDSVKIVENADAEIAAVKTFDPAKTVIVDQRFAKFIEGKSFKKDTTAFVMLDSYAPNNLVYKYKSNTDQLLVFSEIHYPEGWHVYLNGEETNYFRVNYVLRGMVAPAGEHEITFEFKPHKYFAAAKVSMVASLLLILGLLFTVYFEFKNKKTSI